MQASQQSNAIIDSSGAEDLLGKGDCLAKINGNQIERVQVPEYDGDFEIKLENQFKKCATG